MQKITPFLWFDTQAEEAANYYTTVFKDSKVISVSRYGEGAPMPKDTAMSVEFELEGQQFFALNGGPQFKFTPAISFFVNCKDQAEVDQLWDKLIADGGEEQPCGWLVDKYGLSWQIIPEALNKFLNDPNKEKAGRAMQAMLKMTKIDVAKLEAAFNGK